MAASTATAAAAAAVSHLTSTPTTPASRAAHPSSSFKPQPSTTTTTSLSSSTSSRRGAWTASFQARRGGPARVTCMAAASYTVTFRTPAGDKVVQAPEDAYLLDTAEEAGLDLPYSCRAGACCSCVARIVGQGAVDQSDGSYLDDDQKAAGYVLTCIAYPTSDLVIETHKEADM